MTSVPPIAFECKPSSPLALAVAALVMLAWVAVWLSGVPQWLRVGLGFFALGYGAYWITRVLRGPLRSVVWRSDGSVGLVLRDCARGGAIVEGQLRGARVLGPLVVLRLGWSRRSRVSMWLLPGSMDDQTMRRLRVRVRTAAIDVDVDAVVDSGDSGPA